MQKQKDICGFTGAPAHHDQFALWGPALDADRQLKNKVLDKTSILV